MKFTRYNFEWTKFCIFPRMSPYHFFRNSQFQRHSLFSFTVNLYAWNRPIFKIWDTRSKWFYKYWYLSSLSGFFYKHSRIAELQAKRQDLSLTPLCHSHPLHKHLDIHSPADYYWELAFAHSYQPDLNLETLVSERKPLITKLRVLWCSPVEGLANN